MFNIDLDLIFVGNTVIFRQDDKIPQCINCASYCICEAV